MAPPAECADTRRLPAWRGAARCVVSRVTSDPPPSRNRVHGQCDDPASQEELRRNRGAARGEHRHRRRLVHRAGRSIGLRQVDVVAHDRRARADQRRRDPHRRQARQRRAAEAARHRDGVPELRAVPAHDGAREHGLLAEAGQTKRVGHREQGRTRRRDPGAEPAARALPAPALRRPAPACGDGPRDRARPAGVPVRRAAVQPRRQAARGDAQRDQGTAPCGCRPPRSMSRTTRSRR